MGADPALISSDGPRKQRWAGWGCGEQVVGDVLLIHGGAHGAWCWQGVMRELAHLGCNSHALDLPGGGDDSTPRASVGSRDYVLAVNAFIDKKMLQDLTLVGHSLAGIILPDVVSANPRRVREVVYIAAFALETGERAIDLLPPTRLSEYQRLAEASSDACLTLDYPVARKRFFSDLCEASARAAYGKLTPQPFSPYLEPARHGAASISSISRYVICRNDENLSFDFCCRMAQKLGGLIEEIDAGHDVMLSKPRELAALLNRTNVVLANRP